MLSIGVAHMIEVFRVLKGFKYEFHDGISIIFFLILDNVHVDTN